MHHALMTAEEYEELPEENELRFLALESICRSKMLNLITQETSEYYDHSLRIEYMTIVATAAEELDIDNIGSTLGSNDIDNFLLRVTKVVTRLRLKTSGKQSPYTVQLSTRTKARIRIEIARLREIIQKSDLEDKRKFRLNGKLSELDDEIDKTRVSFNRVMTVLAIVGGSVFAGTSFLADAPEALATITSLVGQDKEAEVKEVERLGAPQPRKALPAPRPERFGSAIDFGAPRARSRELDDDITF